MRSILFYIFLVLCIILFLIICSKNKQIKKINSVLREIEKGNFNQRVRLNTYSKNIKDICETSNLLVDKFQNIFTECKHMEESRKKMISNISHDLRTPLTSLLGYIEAIKNDTTLDDNEKEKYINIAYEKATSLHGLLEDFFSLSKIESDDIILNFEKVDICETVREIILSFYEDFVKINITPVVEIIDENIIVNVDKKSIYRILNNLISNTLKYGVDGGKIGIKVNVRDKFVLINVWDNGKGISSKEIPFIFDRLYTLEYSRNSKLQGTGIGLTIVKRLVEKNNGKISVKSTPFEKTEFTIALPFKKYN